MAIGLLTSAYPPRRAVLERASGLARAFRHRPNAELATQAARGITLSLSPNERVQHALHPWSSFVVVPLFALTNAGLDLSGELLDRALGSTLVMGIILGLVVGKTLGIPAGAWLATRPRFGGNSGRRIAQVTTGSDGGSRNAAGAATIKVQTRRP